MTLPLHILESIRTSIQNQECLSCFNPCFNDMVCSEICGDRMDAHFSMDMLNAAHKLWKELNDRKTND